ncbi:MAG: hypothetical protein QOH71_4245 [Blastocatellia bacterium]|jgi:predicted transcriptional regulator|nr:hypothetical protein [Blastocatellia bacterium]
MTNKQIVEDLLQRIPEGASLNDIAREIEFVAAVRQGLDELDRGERIPIEGVERELPSWVVT